MKKIETIFVMKYFFSVLILSFIAISCSKSEPTAKEYFPDYDRIDQFKNHRVDSNVRYLFNEDNNYSSFSTGSFFAEVYKDSDSLVIDDYTSNYSVIRRCIKFNSKSIVIYSYDNQMEFLESKTIVSFNEKKIITQIKSFFNENNSPEGFKENNYFLFYHDINDNLTKIDAYFNENYRYNSLPDWRNYKSYYNFNYFNHPFPTLGSYFYLLRPELFNIFYNKGYRYSRDGVKSFNRIDYDIDGPPDSFSVEIQQINTLDFEVKHFLNGYDYDNYDYFISFTSLLD